MIVPRVAPAIEMFWFKSSLESSFCDSIQLTNSFDEAFVATVVNVTRMAAKKAIMGEQNRRPLNGSTLISF